MQCLEVDPLAPPGRAAWQHTNVMGGDVLALSASGADCVALIQADRSYQVLHSGNDGMVWSAPWPELSRDLHATALLASPDAVFVGFWRRGVLHARNARLGTFSAWEESGAGLPEDAVVTSMAHSNTVIFAGTQRHGILTRAMRGHGGLRWRPMSFAATSREAIEAVTSIAVLEGRLVGAGALGLVRIDEEGGGAVLDRFWADAPVGVARAGGRGLTAWSPRGVRYAEDGEHRWFGLPDPPRDAFVRGAAGAGKIVVAIMHMPQGGSVHRWSYGAQAWTPFEDGLPTPVRPSSVLATSTSILLGTADRGIFRFPVGSGARMIPADVLTLEDEQRLQAGSTVRFALHRPGDVRVQLYSPGGECLRESVLESLRVGSHEISLADAVVTPGVYTFTLRSQGLSQSGRRVILE